MTYPSITFVITGDAATQRARDFVIERDHAQGARFLCETLSMGWDQAFSVLAGTHRLVGDSRQGVELVADDSEDARSYRDEVAAMYAGYLKHERAWYRPYAYVVGYGAEDMRYAQGEETRICSSLSAKRAVKQSELRARYYARDREVDRIYSLKVEHNCGPSDRYVLFEKVDEPPLWFVFPQSPLTNPAAALDAWFAAGNRLEMRGA